MQNDWPIEKAPVSTSHHSSGDLLFTSPDSLCDGERV